MKYYIKVDPGLMSKKFFRQNSSYLSIITGENTQTWNSLRFQVKQRSEKFIRLKKLEEVNYYLQFSRFFSHCSIKQS